MRGSELERYRVALQSKKIELSTWLRSREGIVIEKTPDSLDEVQLAGERELAIRNLDRESKLLQSVRTALTRIEDGSYGVCLSCDAEINPRRLGAVPWAAFCVRCQEAADQQASDGDAVDSPHKLLAV